MTAQHWVHSGGESDEQECLQCCEEGNRRDAQHDAQPVQSSTGPYCSVCFHDVEAEE